MKIAVIGLRAIGPEAVGGVEKAIEELSTRFVEQGHEVTVFCRARYARNLRDSYRGVRIRKLSAIYTKHLETITNTIAAVFSTLGDYDIVHINASGPALLAFLPRLLRRKVVVTVHGLDWKREKWGWGARLILKVGAWAAAAFPNRTVVVSRTLREHYRIRYKKDVLYIPNGVTPPGSRPSSDPTNQFGLVQDGYILFLSRLVPEKGCHTLIQAFRRLETDKKLVIVGPPSHSEEYSRSLRELAAGDTRIIFTGPLFGEQKDAIYRGACLFVLPSTIEGMALVLLEAMSYGKCCLCSNIEENLEVIDPINHGTGSGMRVAQDHQNFNSAVLGPVAEIFETGNIEDLRRQLAKLLQDPARIRLLSERARVRVAEEFDWDSISKQYIETFEEVLAS